MSGYGYQTPGANAYNQMGAGAGSEGMYASQYGAYASLGPMGSMYPQDPVGAGGTSAGAGEFGGGKLSTGILAAFSTSGYPGEPPLLEEIGLNFSHVAQKTRVVLNPFSAIESNIMDDADLAGPVLFFLLFALTLLLGGKKHFSYVYGIALLGTLWQYAILNLMALRSINLIRTTSVLGYCLLPLIVLSSVAVFVSLDNAIGYSVCTLAILWCAYSSSAIFVSYLQLSEMRVLIAYPLSLFYGIFSLMTLFADKALIK